MRPLVWLLTTLGLLSAIAVPCPAAVIAEFSGGTSTGGGRVMGQLVDAQAFDLVVQSSASEIQLDLGRWGGSTGNVVVKLVADSDDMPGSSVYATVSKPATDVPLYSSKWVSFKFGSNVALPAGTYWITCAVSAGSDATIDWTDVSGNPYGTGHDFHSSGDGGATWDQLQTADLHFKVFGQASSLNTTTTVAASPATVATQGVSTITVTVRDLGNNLVQGEGTVNLTANYGNLTSSSLKLSNGQATTTWKAPNALQNTTIQAQFPAYTYGGNSYTQSSGNTMITVIAEQRSTTATLTLDAASTLTNSQVGVNVTVKDSLNNLVPGGDVSFTCTGGSLSPVSQGAGGGYASSTYSSGLVAGTFTITASYSGFQGVAVNYGASEASQSITVEYVDVPTTTVVTASPDYPYKWSRSWVVVRVVDGAGNQVPGGTVQLSATDGFGFDSSTITLAGGIGSTRWVADSTTGGVTITANYQQHIAGGNRYLASSGNDSVTVVADPDSTGETRAWMTDWNSDYPGSEARPTVRDASQGFSNTLRDVIGWLGHEHANQTSWETDMKRSADGGKENDYLDIHDIFWYSGHGTPDYITFITDHQDKRLYNFEAAGAWGTRDTEWVALYTCLTMDHDSDWAKTMNGVHLECGFETLMDLNLSGGGAFADLLTKAKIYDEPHKVHQAWFLAADMSQNNDVMARVIGENESMFNDYIWGEGFVSGDPVQSSQHHSLSQWAGDQSSPTADAGGPYAGVVGQILQLDASASTDADSKDRLFYAWDMDTGTNTDDADWNNDGIDGTDDDGDAFGRHAQYIYNAAGNYNIKLYVFDNESNMGSDIGSAVISNSMSPGLESTQPGDIGVVDNYPGLPPENQMPMCPMIGTTAGFNEKASIGGLFGMEGAAGLDGTGSYTMTDGADELMINRFSGSVMYVNREKAYEYTGPPGSLPTDVQAVQIAENFMNISGIQRPGAVSDSVTQMVAQETEEGSRTRLSTTAFQKRVNYRRTINVVGQPYPVVGPGGKITVMLGETGQVVLFVKVWRETYPQSNVPLYPVQAAIQDFHNMTSLALVGGSEIPQCKRIEIDNVSVGYYEADFVTNQAVIFPVYILDLTVEDDNSSWKQQVYMSAVSPPLMADITSPAADTQIDYGQQIALSGSASGGISPYAYEWYSDVDGLLGTGASINASLTGSQKEGQAQQHTISLRVTDNMGLIAEDTVRVKVLPQNLSNARALPDGAPVWLLGPIVSGVLTDRFYFEKTDRSAGMASNIAPFPQEGDAVNISGVMATYQGERMVQPGLASVVSSGNPIPEPLFMHNRSLGGADFGPYAPGVAGGFGLYDIGLLVTLAGRVTYVSPSNDYFIIDDASTWIFQALVTTTPVKVLCQGFQPPASGSFALVTGISGAEEDNGQIISVLRMRDQTDLLGEW